MSGMFEQVRQEAETSKKAAARHPVRRRLLAVAAAAVVVGGGTAALVETTSSGNAPQATRVVTLTGFDHGPLDTKAVVRIVHNRTIEVDASKLPKLDGTHAYELWLTDGARKNMLPVGFIGNNNQAQLTVTPEADGALQRFRGQRAADQPDQVQRGQRPARVLLTRAARFPSPTTSRIFATKPPGPTRPRGAHGVAMNGNDYNTSVRGNMISGVIAGVIYLIIALATGAGTKQVVFGTIIVAIATFIIAFIIGRLIVAAVRKRGL